MKKRELWIMSLHDAALLNETLDLDRHSSAFSAELRKDISRALDHTKMVSVKDESIYLMLTYSDNSGACVERFHTARARKNELRRLMEVEEFSSEEDDVLFIDVPLTDCNSVTCFIPWEIIEEEKEK